MNNSDMPAMPVSEDYVSEFANGRDNTDAYSNWVGLTKREHFAGLAMQGLLSSGFAETNTQDIVAEWAYAYADALLVEPSKAGVEK